MDYRDSKGGEHGANTSTTIHGAPNQGSNNIMVVKCQDSQVSGMGSRSKGYPFSPDGPMQIPICQHKQGTLYQMVRV
jgi:hypothetical protein